MPSRPKYTQPAARQLSLDRRAPGVPSAAGALLLSVSSSAPRQEADERGRHIHIIELLITPASCRSRRREARSVEPLLPSN